MKRLLLILNITICIVASAQDSLNVDSVLLIYKDLEEVEVVQRRIRPIIENSPSALTVNLKEIETFPKFMGQNDPLRYLQTVAGVANNNESTAGIYVQGCDNSHTLLEIDHAPVFYPNHLLSLFSGFISSHLETMQFEKSVHSGCAANRLGGYIALNSKEKSKRPVQMDGNIGLISSDFTLGISCGKKSDLFISARASYINLLFSKWLTIYGMRPRYGFEDANITYSIHATQDDEITLSAYFGNDKMSVTDSASFYTIGVDWQNMASSVNWTHALDSGSIENTLYCSGFRNHIQVTDVDYLGVVAPSEIGTIGYHNRSQFDLKHNITLQAGADYAAYISYPLFFHSHNDFWQISFSQEKQIQTAHEVSVYGDIRHRPLTHFYYTIGLRASLFACKKQCYYGLDPRINFFYDINQHHHLSAHIGTYSQYLHNVGLVGGGLPADFWLLSTSKYKPERAQSASIGYMGDFAQKTYSITAEIYYKYLHNTVESDVNPIELLSQEMNYQDDIYTGKGQNFGLDLMLQKNKGAFRGYISYSLGWALRYFPELSNKPFDSSHSRRHQLLAVASYRFNDSWSIGATFTLASGTPYTKPLYAYLMSGKLVAEYGDYNAAHLPLTHRLDLSVDYTILHRNGKTLGLNLSLYNVYCHKNVQFVTLNPNDLRLKQISFLGIIIPSLNLYFSF